MSECIEIRPGAAITAFVDEYVKRISRVIDEQALAKVEQQLADYGYVKAVRCRDCAWYLPHPGIQITYGVCLKSHLEVDDNGFCAWAEALPESNEELGIEVER